MQTEIERVFELQRRNQRRIKARSAEERIDTLKSLKAALERHTPAIATALTVDIGRRHDGDVPAEVSGAITTIDDTVAKLAQWMVPESFPSADGIAYSVRYEPRGTVLLFVPWNYPILLLFDPLIAILAAGNTCIIKTNEMMPESSRAATALIREIFDEEHVAICEGPVSLSEALLELPFDHFFLTGSPRVGKMVMAAAAKHLSSVTLELGGKCPAIIDGSYDMKKAAQPIAFGATFDMGQTCQCVDYVAIPAGRFDEFRDAIEAEFRAIWYKNGSYDPSVMAHFVNRANFDRVKGYLDDALARGAKVALGGGLYEAELAIEPTLLRNVPLDASIMQNEIFGPIIPIIEYENIEEVYRFIEDDGKPLNLFIFSENKEFVDGVIDNTSAGSTCVNSWLTTFYNSDLPFGGVNKSGIGQYHGVHGFRDLSNARAIALSN
jgi:aldehyde dehydrogenase (NAD+)